MSITYHSSSARARTVTESDGASVDHTSQFTFYPVRISDCVFIGEKCIIEAAQIGLGVDIGPNCIIVSN